MFQSSISRDELEICSQETHYLRITSSCSKFNNCKLWHDYLVKKYQEGGLSILRKILGRVRVVRHLCKASLCNRSAGRLIVTRLLTTFRVSSAVLVMVATVLRCSTVLTASGYTSEIQNIPVTLTQSDWGAEIETATVIRLMKNSANKL